MWVDSSLMIIEFSIVKNHSHSDVSTRLNSFCVPVHIGLQHLVLFPASPYGLPLDFTILPQKLKESGMYIHKQELADDTYDIITAISCQG